MRRKLEYILVLVGLAAATGSGLVLESFMAFVFLAMCTFLSMFLTGVGFVVDLIFKSSFGIRLTGYLFIILLTATLTWVIKSKLSMEHNTRISNTVIQALYRYRSDVGHFPQAISGLPLNEEVKRSFNKTQQYTADDNLQSFEIYGWTDGWNMLNFNSKDSAWVLED